MGNAFCKVVNCFNDEKPQPLPEPQTKKKNDSNILRTEEEKNDMSISEMESQMDSVKGSINEQPQLNKLTIDDFVIVQKLGKGAFGSVYKVKRRIDQGDNFYAMKVQRKQEIVDRKLTDSVILEKNVLLNNNHPYMVDLRYCFQSSNKIYMIMEYMPHGNLFNFMRQFGKFEEKVAKFIFAEVVLGIQQCHEKLRIIYRDLKPENILVDDLGHVKIADFGLSRLFKNHQEKTYTMAGTAEYLAPEILLKKGHNKNADLWALGIFLYEIMCGIPPFTDQNRSFPVMAKLILGNQPYFPNFLSPLAQDLIKQLLQNDPNSRLGSQNMENLKAHQFFEGVNWIKLIQGDVEGPLQHLIPKKKKRTDFIPRQIYETPDANDGNLPHIQGLTYNKDNPMQLKSNLSNKK